VSVVTSSPLIQISFHHTLPDLIPNLVPVFFRCNLMNESDLKILFRVFNVKSVRVLVPSFGSETWVISAANMRKLSSFHHGCARFISNRHIQPDDEGIWTYPSNESVLEDAGFFTMETYIQRRRDTIFNFGKNRPIYQRCMESEVVASSKTIYWWEQHFSSLNT
jgi:hypothetical protein